ncbi:MAG: hypothetical protein U0836_01540 [Pirellulales bacterium]
MIDSNLREQLLTKFDVLPVDQQRRVLDFALSLPHAGVEPPEGTSGQDLVRFVGLVSAEDAAEMMRAIEDAFEQVEPDE